MIAFAAMKAYLCHIATRLSQPISVSRRAYATNVNLEDNLRASVPNLLHPAGRYAKVQLHREPRLGRRVRGECV